MPFRMTLIQAVVWSNLAFAQQTPHLPADAFEDSEDKLRRPLATLRAERADTEAELRRLELPRLGDKGPDTIRCTRLSDLEPTESVSLERNRGVTKVHWIMASPSLLMVLKPRELKGDLFVRTVSLLHDGGLSAPPKDKTSHPGLRPSDVYVVADPVYS